MNRSTVWLWDLHLAPSLLTSLCFHEEMWIENCPSTSKPSFYRCHINDCFLLFHLPKHIPLILNYSTSINSILTSTLLFKNEPNSSIPFPDIQIMHQNGPFSTSVYHKSSLTGLFTNFHSFIPFCFKRVLILSLLHHFFQHLLQL